MDGYNNLAEYWARREEEFYELADILHDEDRIRQALAGDEETTAKPDEYFGPVIFSYTRAHAIEDGVLVDVSETAKEAGFRWPVAVTAGVWALVKDIPPSQSHQDADGRLWDVLWMARCAAHRGGTETLYNLILHNGHRTYATLKLHSGPGDDGEPVITIMLPDED